MANALIFKVVLPIFERHIMNVNRFQNNAFLTAQFALILRNVMNIILNNVNKHQVNRDLENANGIKNYQFVEIKCVKMPIT